MSVATPDEITEQITVVNLHADHPTVIVIPTQPQLADLG